MMATLYRAGIRPRLRYQETMLLALMGVALSAGWVSLASQQAGRMTIGDPAIPVIYVGILFAIHLAFVLTGRRMDQVLLPVTGMLGSLSLLLMARLPQGLAGLSLGGLDLGLAPLQLLWLSLALAVLAILAVAVRNDSWLREYKYTWAAVGIGLLLLVFVLPPPGTERIDAPRLSLRIGPITGQPSELLKVILVVFLAGYLAENRTLLARTSTRFGPVSLPPVPYLLPMLAMWGVALAVVIVQRDLGAALLFFTVFLTLLYAATRRFAYVVLGMAMFLAGAAVLYQLFPLVRIRVDVWLDPWSDPLDTGFQIIHALYAFGRGGILGTGMGAGLPAVGDTPGDLPAIHTDFVYAALGEELGMLGALAIVALYAIIAERGLRIAARAADDFRALLATGLTLVIVIQAALIIGGNLKLVPLTGITLPFISYGGSSLLANAIVIGLLLALSDRGVEPPPPPSGPRRFHLPLRSTA